MSDGDALLLSLVRRKGSPHALADWLLERLPGEDFEEDADRPALVAASSRTLVCGVRFEVRRGDGICVKMWLFYKLRGRSKTYSPMFHIDLREPDGAARLARYLNETFIRRKW